MKKLIYIFLILAFFGVSTANAQIAIVGASGLLTRPTQSETCVDTGDGAAGALTITPTSNIIKLTNADAHGCDITMSETGMADGMRVEIWNISANSATIANSAGVQEVNADGTITIGEWQKAILLYSTDTWVVTQ